MVDSGFTLTNQHHKNLAVQVSGTTNTLTVDVVLWFAREAQKAVLAGMPPDTPVTIERSRMTARASLTREADEDVVPASPRTLRRILQLVKHEFPRSVPSETEIEGWSVEQQLEVQRWAAAVHLVASDNDDVVIPNMPEVLDESTDPEGALAEHRFEPSHTGMVCDKMVMRDGSGEPCGRPFDEHLAQYQVEGP